MRSATTVNARLFSRSRLRLCYVVMKCSLGAVPVGSPAVTTVSKPARVAMSDGRVLVEQYSNRLKESRLCSVQNMRRGKRLLAGGLKHELYTERWLVYLVARIGVHRVGGGDSARWPRRQPGEFGMSDWSSEGACWWTVWVARCGGPVDIVVEGGTVVNIIPVDAVSLGGYDPGFTRPTGDRVIDAEGMYIVPGFVDMHAHIPEGRVVPAGEWGRSFAYQLWLAHGVTSASRCRLGSRAGCSGGGGTPKRCERNHRSPNHPLRGMARVGST